MIEGDDARLWDPQRRGEAPLDAELDALEASLREFRAPARLPTLELEARPRALDQRRLWALAAALALFTLSMALAWFALHRDDENSGAEGPRASVQVEPRALKAPRWTVEYLDEDPDCQSAESGEGQALDGPAVVETAADQSARLRAGPAVVELHGASKVEHAARSLRLVGGSLWADLTERSDGRAWALSVGELQLETGAARLRLVARPDAPLELEVERGQLRVREGERSFELGPGARCTAAPTRLPVAGWEPLRCEGLEARRRDG